MRKYSAMTTIKKMTLPLSDTTNLFSLSEQKNSVEEKKIKHGLYPVEIYILSYTGSTSICLLKPPTFGSGSFLKTPLFSLAAQRLPFYKNICSEDPLSKIRSNLNNSNTDGSFTMANSNSFLIPAKFFR